MTKKDKFTQLAKGREILYWKDWKKCARCKKKYKSGSKRLCGKCVRAG